MPPKMMNPGIVFISFAMLAFCISGTIRAAEHPNLLLTREGVEQIRAGLGNVPIFDQTLEQVRKEIDAEITLGIDVPIPKDFSGGYTHQQHKKNWFTMQKAGVLYQILQDEKYAVYIRDMLFEYEAMYKDLPLHPQERSYARGKLFWQSLNDSNWLLYVSQAYDAIYEWLSEEERKTLEENLFRPFADFLSVENPQFFNRVHNHSTWGTAAVGMIGLVMGDEELVNRALYGVGDAVIDPNLKDNDGGLIIVPGQQPGFLANLEHPFSPDGYYTEGPYYQRYAMFPFLVFSVALNNAKPELDIFNYKNGALLKGAEAMLNLSDADGEFFPLNDAQKGMSYYASSVVSAVDITYHLGGQNPQLLSIAESQGEVLLDDSGFSVAKAIHDGKARPLTKQSVNLRDGADGLDGGVAILRADDLELVFKYSAQGLSHGHYDKLSFSLYESGNEVLQDYGMVRFVNIGQKGGGNYLDENATWSKQTIAHNTLTINGTSHFGGDYETGSKHHSEHHFFDSAAPDMQIVSARESNAYPGIRMRRTMALLSHPEFEAPLVLDLFKVTSDQENQYDLPFYYLGQLIEASFEHKSPEILSAMGNENGYQHLYAEGVGKPENSNAQVTWLDNGRFHTLTTATTPNDEILFTRTGANDPEFNLRRDPGLMLRRKNTRDTVFATVIESHGSYDPVTESAQNSYSQIAHIEVLLDDSNYSVVSIEASNNSTFQLIVASDDSTDKQHSLVIADNTYQWSGPYHLAITD